MISDKTSQFDPNKPWYFEQNAKMMKINYQLRKTIYDGSLLTEITNETFKSYGTKSITAGLQFDRLKKHNQMVLANLLDIYDSSDGICSGSYNRSNWTKENSKARYNRNAINVKYFNASVDALVKIGMVDIKKGFINYKKKNFRDPKNKNKFHSSNTKVRLTEYGRSVLSDIISYSDITENAEPIELNELKNLYKSGDDENVFHDPVATNDKEKKLKIYEDDDKSVKMRKELWEYMKLMDQHEFQFPYNLQNNDPKEKRRLRNLKKDFVLVRRIFRDDWNTGGRYYMGWQSKISSKYRDLLMIDECETLELDYSSLHPRILYNTLNLKLQHDPYAIAISSETKDFDRKLAKLCMLAAINADNFYRAAYAIRSEVTKDDAMKAEFDKCKYSIKTIKDLINLLIKRNKEIKHFFFNSKWGYLQHVDSEMSNIIIKEFVNRQEPILPLHDSFIVKDNNTNRELLTNTMHNAYETVMRFSVDADELIK